MFRDRSDAGRRLAPRLIGYSLQRPLILALPRGGVPVAVEIATALDADLDVLVVRKLGVPGNPEFAMGAVGEDGDDGVSSSTTRCAGSCTSPASRSTAIVAEQRAGDRATRAACTAGRAASSASPGATSSSSTTALATGSTAAAAVAVVKHLGAAHVTVAVPVASVQALEWLAVARRRRRLPRNAAAVLRRGPALPDLRPGERPRGHARRWPSTRVEAAAGAQTAGRPSTTRSSSSPASSSCAGHLTVPANARGIVRVRARQRQQPPQPAQSSPWPRSSTARASARCCSTC